MPVPVVGGGGGARENGGVWSGLIVDGDGSVGSVIASIVVDIIGIYFSSRFLFPLMYLQFARNQLQTSFSQKLKNKVTRLWGVFLMNLSYI